MNKRKVSCKNTNSILKFDAQTINLVLTISTELYLMNYELIFYLEAWIAFNYTKIFSMIALLKILDKLLWSFQVIMIFQKRIDSVNLTNLDIFSDYKSVCTFSSQKWRKWILFNHNLIFPLIFDSYLKWSASSVWILFRKMALQFQNDSYW